MTTLKADIAAADRVLKAAVRKARQEIADGEARVAVKHGEFVWKWRTYDRAAVVDMLTAATHAAGLLLDADAVDWTRGAGS